MEEKFTESFDDVLSEGEGAANYSRKEGILWGDALPSPPQKLFTHCAIFPMASRPTPLFDHRSLTRFEGGGRKNFGDPFLRREVRR